MNNEGQINELVLFRQAATSMSAGVLLAAVGLTPIISYMGFSYAFVSFLLVIAAGLQLISKANKFCEKARRYGESLTFSFFIISILSIILNWAQIMGASTQIKTAVTPNFIQIFFKHVPLYFVLALGIILILVQCINIYKATKRKMGLKRTSINFVLVLALLAGVYVVSSLPFANKELVPKVTLLVICSLGIPLILYYLSSKSRISEVKYTCGDILEIIRL